MELFYDKDVGINKNLMMATIPYRNSRCDACV